MTSVQVFSIQSEVPSNGGNIFETKIFTLHVDHFIAVDFIADYLAQNYNLSRQFYLFSLLILTKD